MTYQFNALVFLGVIHTAAGVYDFLRFCMIYARCASQMVPADLRGSPPPPKNPKIRISASGMLRTRIECFFCDGPSVALRVEMRVEPPLHNQQRVKPFRVCLRLHNSQNAVQQRSRTWRKEHEHSPRARPVSTRCGESQGLATHSTMAGGSVEWLLFAFRHGTEADTDVLCFVAVLFGHTSSTIPTKSRPAKAVSSRDADHHVGGSARRRW